MGAMVISLSIADVAPDFPDFRVGVVVLSGMGGGAAAAGARSASDALVAGVEAGGAAWGSKVGKRLGVSALPGPPGPGRACPVGPFRSGLVPGAAGTFASTPYALVKNRLS